MILDLEKDGSDGDCDAYCDKGFRSRPAAASSGSGIG